MLSLLLVAGAASGDFLSPIKSHHHQESLNLKESSDDAQDPKKGRLDQPLDLSRTAELNLSSSAGGASDCANCKAGNKGCQDCKGHNDLQKEVMGILRHQMHANVVEQQNARAKIEENQKQLAALQGQQAADKAWSDDRSAKLKATRGVTKAATALMSIKNAFLPGASQAGSSSMGAGSSSIGAHASQSGERQAFSSYVPSAGGAQRGFPIQHQVNQGSRGGALNSSSRSTSTWDPTGRFAAGSRSSTVTSGAYDSGSTGGFGSGGWGQKNCPASEEERAVETCLCQSTRGGGQAICFFNQKCIRSQDPPRCDN